MTYEAFLERLITPIQLFFSTITQWSTALFTNYFFITILGGVLFCSFVIWCVNNLVFKNTNRLLNQYDDYEDTYNNYDLYKDVQMAWYSNNRSKVYSYKYDNKVINENVKDMYKRQISKQEKEDIKKHINPEWLGKDIVGEPLTPEEEKELSDILDNF